MRLELAKSEARFSGQRTRLALGLAAVCGVFFAPANASAPDAAVLKGLSKGQWTVNFRGGDSPRKICVRTGWELIKLRHRDAGCNQQVVRSSANSVTVQYTCPGNGHGHTQLRRETASLVQIESRGIAGGLPFEVSAEARRTGNCR
ncbi:DUF3617 domain-containing protein [Altererythrobacter aquiaggeris]|uniref:DUF3617 domain-containing protein n=1 Tax=Aestuarierythrobacter aquiaggeris TaxID=1898396 RepID=UPI0030191D39